ncbi:hypothetical protein MG293_010912 [Ovis ammon polii]|uniref:Uncharacterized protein n=1 Tax=Ovis ammon polii TaxID=230172 RepID=A0AAD4Y5M6_OVIAM|nr:hypothetical protein MG293_010912 [Ovis ammon polii]
MHVLTLSERAHTVADTVAADTAPPVRAKAQTPEFSPSAERRSCDPAQPGDCGGRRSLCSSKQISSIIFKIPGEFVEELEESHKFGAADVTVENCLEMSLEGKTSLKLVVHSKSFMVDEFEKRGESCENIC